MNRTTVFLRSGGRIGLAVLLLSVSPGAGAREGLPPGEARERPIAAGEVHAWTVEVGQDASLLVTVEQQSIDLVVEAQGPDGGEPVVVDGGNDRWGPEVLLLANPGVYGIQVRPRKPSAWPGRYTVRVDAVPADSPRRPALALMSRAGREAPPDTPGSRQQAAATYREALAVWRSLGERAWEAEALTCLALLEVESSELQPAKADFQAALALWRELGVRPREAEALNWLGGLYGEIQGIDQARGALEGALALWEDLGERLDAAETRGNLCLLEHRQGVLAAALACYQENLALYRGLGLAEQEALMRHNIGGVYDLQGEPDEALASYQQALALRQALGDRSAEAETLNNIAVVHRALGEWQEALRVYDRAREVLANLGDGFAESAVLNNVGFLYNSVGEPQRALIYLTDALALRRKVGNRAGEIVTLNNLGSAWRKLGDLDKALDYHRQALALAASLGNTAQQAVSRQRLAEVHLDRGEAAAALRELEPALPIVRENGNRRAETEALHLQGRALALAGRAREAVPVLQQTLALRRDLRDRAGETETLTALAGAERSSGLAADALAHAEAAVARAEELRTAFLSADLRAASLAARRRAFSLLIDLLMDRHAAEPEKGFDRAAFAVSERARARSLLDGLRAGSAGRTGNLELLARRSALLRRLGAKADQRLRQGGDRAQALERESEAVVAELEAVEAEVRRQDPRFAAFSAPQPAGSQEIASWLEPGTALLEYSLGDDRSFLWLVEAGRLQSFVLPGQRTIEELARRVHQELSTVEPGGPRPGDAESLGRILLSPLWSGAAPLRRLVVVPDGSLGLVPFAALPVPAPGRSWQAAEPRQPLIEFLEVVSIPSATTLAVQRQRLQRVPAAKWAAVLADPVFAADDPRLARHALTPQGPATVAALREEAFQRLPATRKEAETVAALAPAGQVWIGEGLAANREAVLSGALRGYRVLHFATHAVADTRHPELSGLVLSQVDAEGHPREGFLGLADVYDLELDADLVVLSGCRTALGKEVRGEGLLGLTRGFQYAGVPRVVASLWRVQDRTTAELMARFYRALWRDHLTPAAALREAQRSLRRDPRYRDPQSWAAFVLYGEWR